MNLRIIILVLVLLSFLSTSIGGYIYYSSIEESSLAAAHLEADELTKDTARNIDLNLAEYKKSVKALAGIYEIKHSLLNKNADSLNKANSMLDHFYSALSANACYLLDNKGNTIASSNRNSPKSFVGKNYSFRPYFKEAINGSPSFYMALGVTSGVRGIYYGHPVYGKDKNIPSGVVVIKTSMRDLDKKLFEHNFIGTISLTDPHGVIFASNRSDWLYHSLWELTDRDKTEISESRQFGKGPWNWIGIEKKEEHLAIDSSGKEYHVHQEWITIFPEWRVVYLHDHNAVYDRVVSPLFKSSGYVVLLISLLTGLSALVLFKLARQDIIRREKAELALQDSERRYRSLYEDTPAMLHSIDSRGRIVSVSNHWLETLGYNHEEVIGKKSTEFLTDDSRYYAETVILPEFFSTGYCKDVEYQFIKKNGEIMDTLLSAIAERDKDNNIIKSFAVIDDITERKKVEEDRERLIHELKNALAEVKTLSGLLPICSSCKKVRDDNGYWNQIEIYIKDRSDADFSHGICPDCAVELYPKYFNKTTNKNNKDEDTNDKDDTKGKG